VAQTRAEPRISAHTPRRPDPRIPCKSPHPAPPETALTCVRSQVRVLYRAPLKGPANRGSFAFYAPVGSERLRASSGFVAQSWPNGRGLGGHGLAGFAPAGLEAGAN